MASLKTTARKALGLFVIAGTLFGAIPAGAGASSGRTLLAHFGRGLEPTFGDIVAPTVGAAQMCEDEPAALFCRGVRSYRPLTLDDATADLLLQVNQLTNSEIEPVDDIELWGVAERWNRPVVGQDGRLRDDCDGYVIEKWYRLVVEHGLPAEAFYPLYADVPGYGGHLVLAVMTDRGTYILDNLRESPVRLEDFSFTFLKRPRPGDRLDGIWERLIVLG